MIIIDDFNNFWLFYLFLLLNYQFIVFKVGPRAALEYVHRVPKPGPRGPGWKARGPRASLTALANGTGAARGPAKVKVMVLRPEILESGLLGDVNGIVIGAGGSGALINCCEWLYNEADLHLFDWISLLNRIEKEITWNEYLKDLVSPLPMPVIVPRWIPNELLSFELTVTIYY